MNEITLAWGYGCRNAGDMAINYGTMEFLHQKFPKTKPTWISRYADGTPEIKDAANRLSSRGYDFEFQGGPIRYNPKRQSDTQKVAALLGDSLRYGSDLLKLGKINPSLWTTLSKTICKSDVLLFNGGNLIHHSPHRRFFPYVLAILYPMVIAKRNNIPYGLLPQTIFNLEGPYESLIKSVLNDAEFIWTRDRRTFAYLEDMPSISVPAYNGLDIGFVGCRQYTPDISRATKESHIAVVPRFSELGDTGDLENSDQSSVENILKEYMATQVSEGNNVTVAVQTNVEKDWVKRNISFLDSTGIEIFESFEQSNLCSFYAGCDLLVTLRLHAGIFALTQGTPSIGIYRQGWGPKMPGTWETLDIQEYVKEWNEVDLSELLTLTSRVLDNPDDVEQKIVSNISTKTKYMMNKMGKSIRNMG